MTTVTIFVFSVVTLFPCFRSSNLPLIGKNVWKTVANYLTSQNEKKFKEIHKQFIRIPNVYEDISRKVIEKLVPHGKFEVSHNWCFFQNPCEVVPWRFFKHLESGKLFAEKVDEKGAHGLTALHRAALENLPQVAIALVEAKISLDEKTDGFGYTALHFAAMTNHLEIGKILIDAGANMNARTDRQYTPLYVAYAFKNADFVKMLQNHMMK